MANLGMVFNPNAFEAFEDFIAIPKGEWNVKIVDSAIEHKEGKEPRLILTFAVDEGSAKGGKIDVHLFLWSAEKKGDVGRRKLTTICKAIGVMNDFQDTAALHNRPLTVTTDVRREPKTDGSGFVEFADIKSFKQYVGGGRAAGADSVQPTAPNQTAPSLPSAPAIPAAPVFAPPQAPVAAPQNFAFPTQQAPAPVQFAAPGPFGAPAPFAAPVPPPFQPAFPGAPAPFGPPR